ncbi:MAG: hypothetical protein ABIR15_15975, partial [Chitinophagaceae bacterium]
MKRILHLLLSSLFFLFFFSNSYAGPDVTISTVAVAAGNINQGSSNNIIYIAKVMVTGSALTINSIEANLGGNFDNDDFGNILLYYNLTAPSLTGAVASGNVPGNVASPHLFTIPAGRVVAAGSTIYILIVTNASNTATDNHTVLIDGAVNPIIINSSSAPVITNSQTDAAGIQTIQAADLSFATIPLTAADINQGSSNNIVYVAKLDVATEPITINSITVNLSGNFDNDDLNNVLLYYNLTAPSLTGAIASGNVPGNVAAPHVFTIPGGRVVPAGSSIYILIVANVNNTATDNHTVTVNGAVDPI